jgi:hypothetical protein
MRAEAAAANVTDRADILGALQRASQVTGADFHFLLDTAMRESSLKPNAKASSSSAVGLFQFVEQTWLGMVKTYGAKYGLGSYADAISQSANGRYHTASLADRSAILALRKDPGVSSLMAGEFAQATRATMQQSLGRDVCSGELYAAHFLGPDAACRLIRMNDSQPDASAAHAFPAAADANRTVFFHGDGRAKTVREVYDWALKQPSGTQAPAPPAASPVPAVASVDTAAMPDSAALLASIVSWRPSHGFFASATGETGAVPSTPFPMTPSVVDVLSSIGPIAGDTSTD